METGVRGRSRVCQKIWNEGLRIFAFDLYRVAVLLKMSLARDTDINIVS